MLWKAEKIKSFLNYCCDEVFIDKINNGKITLHYKFRTSEDFTDQYGERKLNFNIDPETGMPVLSNIE